MSQYNPNVDEEVDEYETDEHEDYEDEGVEEGEEAQEAGLQHSIYLQSTKHCSFVQYCILEVHPAQLLRHRGPSVPAQGIVAAKRQRTSLSMQLQCCNDRLHRLCCSSKLCLTSMVHPDLSQVIPRH